MRIVIDTNVVASGILFGGKPERLLEDYLEDIEDIYLPEQVLAEIRSGKQKTYSADEVFAEAGL